MQAPLRETDLNRRAAALLDALLDAPAGAGLRSYRLDNGTRIIDAGIDCRGGIEAGRHIAEICMGGYGRVSFVPAAGDPALPRVAVHAANPVVACLGSQYAGWSLSHGEGKAAFRALGSGPARVLARKEALLDELGLAESHDRACLVLEVDQVPPPALAQRIAEACAVAAERLDLVLTPTRSLAGTTQVVARVLEVALHKTHELGFPLHRVVDGFGTAPLPPPGADFIAAMGRSNDAILFAGEVHLYVDADDDAARDLAARLPSSASRDYGRPFAEVFEAYDYDFFRIDPLLFSPARVSVTALGSGRTFAAGRIDTALLHESLGLGA
jgi:methenyltetrahydromethanopterin cyclohydrolase